jgi:hypothetical protein
MKALFKNIIDAPAATIAGGLVAALAVITGADLDLPKGVIVGLMAFSALLATFSGPNKPKP